MRIFESHAHLDSKDFEKDREQLINNCRKQGIEYIINIGCNKKTITDSIALAKKYDFIYAAAGYHPHDATELDVDFVRKAANNEKVVAIGEIGLDYFRNLSPKKIQQQAFRAQLELATQIDKPIVIHNREADEDTFKILMEYKPKKVVYHCFSGDVIYAEEVLAQGWYISFTGNITYKKSNLPEVVRMTPPDRFFIETDCPYLTPHPHRGKRNDPTNLRYVIEKIADIKRISPLRAAEFSYQNAKKFFLNGSKT